jgi:indolepyruvate decarboxylase
MSTTAIASIFLKPRTNRASCKGRCIFAGIPHALGYDGWFTARVTTYGDFDEALANAQKANSGVYIEVVTDAYAASPLPLKLHESLETLYQS